MKKELLKSLEEPLKMRLQLFAEDETDETAAEDETDTDTVNEEQQEEMVPKSQMEKIIKDRVAREKKTYADKIADIQKKATMTAEEAVNYDLEQEREQLRVDRLELQKERDEANIATRLNSEELSTSLTAVFKPLFGNKEELDSVYPEVIDAYRKSVEEAVNKRLAQSAEIPGSGGSSAKLSVGETMAKQLNEQTKPATKSLWD